MYVADEQGRKIRIKVNDGEIVFPKDGAGRIATAEGVFTKLDYSHPFSTTTKLEGGYKGNARCAGLPNWDPANYNEADVSDKPAYIQARRPVPYVDGWPTVPFCESMLALDQEFTRIRKELTKEGRFDNTLFLLTTDNGMAYGAHRVGTKYVPYATQMPLFAYWASGRGVDPAQATNYLSNVDIAPTLCELGGCTMGPYPNGQKNPDGQSFLGLLTPQSSSVPVRTSLYEENRGNTDGWPPWRALRTTTSSRKDYTAVSNLSAFGSPTAAAEYSA